MANTANGYVTTDEVLAAAGITTSEVSNATVLQFINQAEKEVDRFTQTTYWAELASATTVSATNDTLTDTGAFTDETYADEICWIYSGTGKGQARKIESHTNDTLTLERDWSTNPDDTSKYRIIHTATDSFFLGEDEPLDGTADIFMYLHKRPIQILESLTIDDTSITISNVFQYKKAGKIQLDTSAEETFFKATKPQQIDIDYWWGVYPIPQEVRKAVITLAAIATLAAQMGSTFNVPSTFQFPEMSGTIGQAYINIDFTRKAAKDMLQEVKKSLVVYNLITR